MATKKKTEIRKPTPTTGPNETFGTLSVPENTQVSPLTGEATPKPTPATTTRKTTQGDVFPLAGSGGIARSEFSSEESYKEAKNIREAQGMGTMGGLNPVTGQTGGQEQAANKADIIKNLEKIGKDLPNVDIEQGGVGQDLLNAGLKVGTISAGVGTGAAIGAMTGPLAPVAVPVLGALGGAGAFIGKMALEDRQDVKVATANFQNAKTSMNALITLAADPNMREQAVNQWNYNLATIRAAEAALREQNKNIIGKKLASNLDELADIEQFKRDYALLYEAQFRSAIMGGVRV